MIDHSSTVHTVFCYHSLLLLSNKLCCRFSFVFSSTSMLKLNVSVQHNTVKN